MRLTRYTDYAMRVLLYLGARPEKLCSIAEVLHSFLHSLRGLSQNFHIISAYAPCFMRP